MYLYVIKIYAVSSLQEKPLQDTRKGAFRIFLSYMYFSFEFPFQINNVSMEEESTILFRRIRDKTLIFHVNIFDTWIKTNGNFR